MVNIFHTAIVCLVSVKNETLPNSLLKRVFVQPYRHSLSFFERIYSSSISFHSVQQNKRKY